MLQNYLYCSTGDGADATANVACVPCSKITGVFPDGNIAGVKTTISFEGPTNAQDKGEYIAVTHSNNTGTGGPGHDMFNVSIAIAEACNSGPHTNGPITIIDLDNNIFYDSLNYLRNDTNLDLQVQLDS